jgi:hypothetical protein
LLKESSHHAERESEGVKPLSTIPTRLNKYTNQRRSQRVMLAVKILVGGDRDDGKRFSKEAETSVVNAHGALISLCEKVTLGQLLTVRNLKSNQELLVEVVDVGAELNGNFEVGIQFIEAAPRFWRVAFPPEDWTPRSPEAKRRTVSPPITPLKTRIPK